MGMLTLHTPLIDWLTLTSRDDEFFSYWENKLGELSTEIKQKKVMQYEGNGYALENGSGFLGTAIQRGFIHYMLRLSGEISDELRLFAYSQQRQGFVKCTRIDLQVTVPMPKTWSQWQLLVDMKENGRTVGWIESKSKNGNFQTVYVGGRSSQRFARVYVKKTYGNANMLRMEMEYKADRANAIFRSLAKGEIAGRYLQHEIQTTFRHKGLSQLFSPCLNGVRPLTERIKIETSSEKTERWLLQDVLPTFTKAINNHESDGRLLDAYLDAINDAIENR